MKYPHLEYLKVKNFKSFKEFDIKLNQLNVIIGANSTGKSNLVQIFNFMRDMRAQGLDNAISLQGGIKYLRNFKLDQKHNLAIELKIVLPREIPMRKQFRRSKHKVFYNAATWNLELQLGKTSGFKVIRDEWNVGIAAYKHSYTKRTDTKAAGHINITTRNGNIRYEPHIQDEDSEFVSSLNKSVLSLNKYFDEKIDGKTLILEYPSPLDYVFRDITSFFDYIQTYDFDPKLAKRAAPLTGKLELADDASNLALIVKEVISDRESRRKFSNLVASLLPFVDSVGMKSSSDKSVLLTLTESYSKKHSLPAPLLSDGTINIAALIVALYFEPGPLAIMEEPERGIHSYLIYQVMEMIREAASMKQIMITTHNAEVVRHADPSDLLTVRRDSDGHSEIARPLDQEDIRAFLKDEIEINELYVQNILGS